MLQAFEDGALHEEDLQDGDEWENATGEDGHELNGSAAQSGVPLAEVAQIVSLEQEEQNSASYEDTLMSWSSSQDSSDSDWDTSTSGSESDAIEPDNRPAQSCM